MQQGGAAPVGGFEQGEFVLPLRVYHADTDAGGVMHHAAYMQFAERGRVEMLRALGWSVGPQAGCNFVVRDAHVEWHAPARLDDLLACRIGVVQIGAAHVVMTHRFAIADDPPVFDARITLINVSARLRAVRIPAGLRQALQQRLAEVEGSG